MCNFIADYRCSCQACESGRNSLKEKLWELEPGTKFNLEEDNSVYIKLNAGTQKKSKEQIKYCGPLSFCDKIYCIDKHFSIIVLDKDTPVIRA